MTPPVMDWEDELARLLAHRLRARATERLAAREWAATDFEDAVEALERRMSARQRELLWETLTEDAQLGGLLADSSRGGGLSLT